MATRNVALAVVIPTYNEADAITTLLRPLREIVTLRPGLQTSVLVVDDNSPDGTAKVVEEFAAANNDHLFSVEVLHRPRKEGLGRAYVDGLQTVLRKGAPDFVLQMDADMSHDPAHIPSFLDAAHDAELVVGSRYVAGGATADWAWYRRVLSRVGNAYARAFLGSAISDYTGGFNLFSADLLRRLPLSEMRAPGYGFVVELKYAALRQARQVREVPIVFVDRREGGSKIPSSTIPRNLLLVPLIRFRRPVMRPASCPDPPGTGAAAGRP